MTFVEPEPVADALHALGLRAQWHRNQAGDPFAAIELPLPTGGALRTSLLRWDDTVVVRAHDLGGPPPSPQLDDLADRLTEAWLLGRVHYSPLAAAWGAGTGVFLFEGAIAPERLTRALTQLGAAVGNWHRAVLDRLPLPDDDALAVDLRAGLEPLPGVSLDEVAGLADAAGVPLEPRLDGHVLVQRLIDDRAGELLVDVVLWDHRLLVIRGRLPAGTRWPSLEAVRCRLRLVNDRLSAGAACVGTRQEPHVLIPLPLADARPSASLLQRLLDHTVDAVASLRRHVLLEAS